jgi:hypothetical protein
MIGDGCSIRMLIPSFRLLFVSLLVDRLVKGTSFRYADATATKSLYVGLSPFVWNCAHFPEPRVNVHPTRYVVSTICGPYRHPVHLGHS